MPEPMLHISPDLSLPLTAVTETFAILAKRRAGKSNAAVVMAEEMYDNALPWVAVDPKGDWWGIRAAGDGRAPGLSVLVFGGMHADVPLEPTAGHLVADLIVRERITAVLDVSEMTKADQRRFLTAFADRLYRTNTEPLHVFCEEADEYIPQLVGKEDTKLVHSFEMLVKRGGFRGIGITLVTQRSASLNKHVLTQVETLIPMRTTGPQDRKAIRDWLDTHADGADAVKELPGLAAGEAFVFSPSWLDVHLQRITFRRRRTFDSGATPKVGEKRRTPTKLADVDLAAIKEAMAETIEKAKADDPAELRKRIRALEQEVAEWEAHDCTPAEPERVEVPVLEPAYANQLEALINPLHEHLDELKDALEVAAKRPPASPVSRVALSRGGRRTTGNPVVFDARARVSPPPRDASTVQLRKGAVRMVESLGRMAPLRLTMGQWGMVAGLKPSGGTWKTYLGEIKRAGLVVEEPTGWTLTDAGFEFIGGPPPPMTAGELQDHYRRILRKGAARMMDALIDAYPDSVALDDLGDQIEMEPTGGTFKTYLGELTRNQLAERFDDLVRATDILMHGASA